MHSSPGAQIRALGILAVEMLCFCVGASFRILIIVHKRKRYLALPHLSLSKSGTAFSQVTLSQAKVGHDHWSSKDWDYLLNVLSLSRELLQPDVHTLLCKAWLTNLDRGRRAT